MKYLLATIVAFVHAGFPWLIKWCAGKSVAAREYAGFGGLALVLYLFVIVLVICSVGQSFGRWWKDVEESQEGRI